MSNARQLAALTEPPTQLTATWVAGVSGEESLITPAKLKNVVNTQAGIGFDPDAYWQDMSSSRSNNIPYQNTTGFMIFVYGWQSDISVSPTNSAYNTIVSGTSGTDFKYSWVPIMPGHWYKLSVATLVWELRGAP